MFCKCIYHCLCAFKQSMVFLIHNLKKVCKNPSKSSNFFSSLPPPSFCCFDLFTILKMLKKKKVGTVFVVKAEMTSLPSILFFNLQSFDYNFKNVKKKSWDIRFSSVILENKVNILQKFAFPWIPKK
jgi:hypothetical protein